MEAQEHLQRCLETEIGRFDEESTRHKRIHRRCALAIIALTAATTIVAGSGLVLPEPSAKPVQFAVLALTAVTTAVAAYGEMRRARELWQHEREIYYALKDIRREMEFAAAARKLTRAQVEEYFDRVSSVLGSSTQKWARIQEKKSKPGSGARK